MAIIRLSISDEDLALIDAEAGNGRAEFMLTAAREFAERRRRARLAMPR